MCAKNFKSENFCCTMGACAVKNHFGSLNTMTKTKQELMWLFITPVTRQTNKAKVRNKSTHWLSIATSWKSVIISGVLECEIPNPIESCHILIIIRWHYHLHYVFCTGCRKLHSYKPGQYFFRWAWLQQGISSPPGVIEAWFWWKWWTSGPLLK